MSIWGEISIKKQKTEDPLDEAIDEFLFTIYSLPSHVKSLSLLSESQELEEKIKNCFLIQVKATLEKKKSIYAYFKERLDFCDPHGRQIKELCNKLNRKSLAAIRAIYDQLEEDFAEKVRSIGLSYFGTLTAYHHELSEKFDNKSKEYLTLQKNIYDIAEFLDKPKECERKQL